MGVEYQHWLLPRDPEFRPDADAAARVHAVLSEWGLAGQHTVHDISKGALTSVSGALAAIAAPETVLVTYGEMVEGSAIRRLLGPSADDTAPYLQKRIVVVGLDQHVFAGGEEVFVEVDGNAVELETFRGALWTSHWAPDAAHVTAQVQAEIPTPVEFTGVFRAAVVLDFGKSIPAFVATGAPRELHERDFVRALESALRTAILEVGFVY